MSAQQLRASLSSRRTMDAKKMGQDDNVVPLSSKALIEHVKEERERLVEQIVQSEKAIAHSRELIARIDRMLAAEK